MFVGIISSCVLRGGWDCGWVVVVVVVVVVVFCWRKVEYFCWWRSSFSVRFFDVFG